MKLITNSRMHVLFQVRRNEISHGRMQCVSHEIFYQRLGDFKQTQKRNTLQLTMFIEDQFYDKAMEYLKI